MARDVLMRFRAGGLYPADKASADLLAKYRDGEMVRVKGMNRPRNPRHHSLYWVLLDTVWQNQETFPTVEQLHRAMKIATALYDEYEIGGKTVISLRSTDFTAMKQDEFNQYYDRVVRLICERVIPGMSDEALKARVLGIVEGRDAA
jgi:hypothetical protein